MLNGWIKKEQAVMQHVRNTLPALAMKYGGSSPIAVPAPYSGCNGGGNDRKW